MNWVEDLIFLREMIWNKIKEIEWLGSSDETRKLDFSFLIKYLGMEENIIFVMTLIINSTFLEK